jgi:hypothetical protein
MGVQEYIGTSDPLLNQINTIPVRMQGTQFRGREASKDTSLDAEQAEEGGAEDGHHLNESTSFLAANKPNVSAIHDIRTTVAISQILFRRKPLAALNTQSALTDAVSRLKEDFKCLKPLQAAGFEFRDVYPQQIGFLRPNRQSQIERS